MTPTDPKETCPEQAAQSDIQQPAPSPFKISSSLRYFGLSAPVLSPETAFHSPASSSAARIIPYEVDPPEPVIKKRPPTVETVSGWRKQDKAERDAHIEEPAQYKVLFPLFRCDTCDICIGPDYVEQELYLYHVYKQHERFKDDLTYTYFEKSVWFYICGGCARHRSKKNPLARVYLMVKPEHWLTTVLLDEEDSQTPVRRVNMDDAQEVFLIRRKIQEHMLVFHRFHLFLLCIQYRIPVRLIFLTDPKEQPKKPRPKSLPHIRSTSNRYFIQKSFSPRVP